MSSRNQDGVMSPEIEMWGGGFWGGGDIVLGEDGLLHSLYIGPDLL